VPLAVSRKLKLLALAALTATCGVQALHAASEDAGAYLAARQADQRADFPASVRYFTQALAADNQSMPLMEALLVAHISQGTPAEAVPVARLLAERKPASQIANMVLLSQAAAGEDYATVLEAVEADHGIGPLVDGLMAAWAELGEGRRDEAIARFDEIAVKPGLQAFGLYHKALALTVAGDDEAAARVFAGEEGGALPPTRRGIIAYTEVLSRIDRQEDAVKLIDDVFGAGLDPELNDLRARLEAGEALPNAAVRSVSDGMSEVFFSVASALDGESNDAYTLLYSRIAQSLRADHSDAHILTASLLERMGQFDLAIAALGRVTRDDPAFYAAEVGRAEALRRAGRDDAALEVMSQLARSHGDIPEVHITLGDMYRSGERYDAAIDAYTSALGAYSGEEPGQWVVYFARGICHERLKQWDTAEADFRKALELEPDQPQVLNYLGYSYLEMNTNLDEALGMIETAVAKRPDDGYITDSLGWGLYMVGRYDEAVVQMERAVELMAVDPIVNDHLGDVYWAVGREREARFQWRRAMSFDPEPEEAERIRRKLEVGLDKVLAEEGARPLRLANDG